MKIGILSLQGGFIEHSQKLNDLDVNNQLVREVTDLKDLDALIIPGGESTALERLAIDIFDELKQFTSNKPTWGTCAGMIYLAKSKSQKTLGLLDIEIERNAYGSQLDSFIGEVELTEETQAFEGVFIRAPKISKLGSQCEVVGTYDKMPVAVRQEHLLATAFHPELTDDNRLHSYFIDMVEASV